jgi:hypothetical protein
VPPAGAQVVARIRALPDDERPRVAVFAGPSARYFEATELAKQAAAPGTADDIPLALTRLDVYPHRLLIASDLPGAAERGLPAVATFCRPPRIDRRAPCITLYEWPLPR